MTFAWAAGAAVIFSASLVMGLTGFGIALVAMAFLPWLMSPVTAVIVLTVYATVFSIVVAVQLRREVTPGALADLLIGTAAGAPLGVWVLSALPVTALNRLIGLVLVGVVALEFRGTIQGRFTGRGWGLGAGFAAGVIGGAIGTPAPPVIVYAAAQQWSPRTMKSNVMCFLAVNQAVILTGYGWAGLITREVMTVAAAYAVPALVGLFTGIALFDRVDPVGFRRAVFAVLFFSGLLLLVRG